LIDTLASVKSTVYLNDAKNTDWEDIAIGPGPVTDKSYLYIGDIGDNASKRTHKTIYRVEEPIVLGVLDTILTKFDSIRFVLEDGPRDTEALIVDPLKSDIYIFSKHERKIKVYRLDYPQSTTELNVAKTVAQLTFTNVTAADISTNGAEILLKTYSGVYYWKRNSDETITNLLQREALSLPYVPEGQGEAVAFNLNGSGYYTTSEVAKGEQARLKFYPRKK
jgi:hypothetical protein